jgi:hypothetical protein
VTTITLQLDDAIYQRAQLIARQTGRELNDVLNELVETSLPPLDAVNVRQPIETLSDDAVLALSELQMQPEQDQRLSTLLQAQGARDLSANERTELQALMHIYETGLLRKTEALVEGVRRGLIDPKQP